MGNSRVFIAQSAATKNVNLRGRLYPGRLRPFTVHTKPHQVDILTRQLTTPGPPAEIHRYPFPELHLGDGHRQSWIHSCVVTVQEGRHTYRFVIFFKRHSRIAPNRSVKHLIHRTPRLRSDAVVMRLGKTEDGYLNMRERDTLLADWFIQRFAIQSFLLRGRKLPKTLYFNKGRATTRALRN